MRYRTRDCFASVWAQANQNLAKKTESQVSFDQGRGGRFLRNLAGAQASCNGSADLLGTGKPTVTVWPQRSLTSVGTCEADKLNACFMLSNQTHYTRLMAHAFLRGRVCVLAVLILATDGGTLASGADYRVLYSFQGGADGWSPSGFLLADSTGEIYGTTIYGGSSTAFDCSSPGSYGCGTVFQLRPPGRPFTKTVLFVMHGKPPGLYARL